MSRRVALITGGTRGIGLGIARALAAEGWDLALNGVRQAEDVSACLDSLRHDGATVIYCRGDIGVAADRQAVIEQVRGEFGRLHALVNNAGITSPGRKDVLEADEETWDRVFDTNLKGPFFLTQLAANWMIEQRSEDKNFGGCIINLTSISSDYVSTNRGDYCLTKAALAMATKLWAARMAEHGVSVYEIRPGIIRSDMTSGVVDKYDRLIAEGLTQQRRWGLPEDVGKAAAMLVRGDLPYSTGQVLRVDGGMTIQTL